MRLRSQLPEYFRLITLLALGLLFGHDMLMVATPHQPQGVHADHAVVEQCGPTEGALTQLMLLPAAHPPAAFLSFDTFAPDQLASTSHENQAEVLADASTRRAMLQVFLN